MLARLISVTALFAAVFLAPGTSHADIVNVQGALAKEPDEGLSGSLTGTVDWRTGNTDLIQVGGAGTARYRMGRVLGLVLARGEYGRGEGTLLAKHVFEHARVRVTLDDCKRWMWEAFVQHEYDEFRRLQVRAVAGTGPALRVTRGDAVTAVIGVAYLFEYRRLDDQPFPDARERSYEHRVSSYLTALYQLDDRVSVSETVYVQPRVDKPSDLRTLSESAIATQLRKWLTLQTAFVVAYDRSPPISIEQLDTQLRTTLTVSW